MTAVPAERAELLTAFRMEHHDLQCRPACLDREACSGRLIQHTPVAGWLAAVELLERSPRDAAGARGLLHDAVCASGCTGARRAEHARTQTVAVRALRRALDRL